MSDFGDLLGYEDHQGDVMSDIAQMDYEQGLIQECRDWLNGDFPKPPTTEHIRVLLAWIDHASPDTNHNKEF